MNNTISSFLSMEERQMAHDLWESLVSESAATHAQLCVAPLLIRQAILCEIVNALQEGQDLQERMNPFD